MHIRPASPLDQPYLSALDHLRDEQRRLRLLLRRYLLRRQPHATAELKSCRTELTELSEHILRRLQETERANRPLPLTRLQTSLALSEADLSLVMTLLLTETVPEIRPLLVPLLHAASARHHPARARPSVAADHPTYATACQAVRSSGVVSARGRATAASHPAARAEPIFWAADPRAAGADAGDCRPAAGCAR